LEHDSKILAVAGAFANMPVTELPLDGSIELRYRDGTVSGLSVETFAVPAGPPRFAEEAGPGHTVGLMIRERQRHAFCAYVPGCGDLDESLVDRLAQADILLFDGTFWRDDELIAAGIGSRTAREMDHLPIGGLGGSLERMSAIASPHR